MSFNLIAEADTPIDWGRLLASLRPIHPGVECFPIPSDLGGGVQALGISLLTGKKPEPTWEGFVVVAERLWMAGMRVFELYSGTEVTPDSLANVQQMFLG